MSDDRDPHDLIAFPSFLVGSIRFHPNPSNASHGLINFMLTPDVSTPPEHFILALQVLKTFIVSGQLVQGIDALVDHVMQNDLETTGRPQ